MVLEMERPVETASTTVYDLRNSETGDVRREGIQAAIEAIQGKLGGIHAAALINGGVNAIIGNAEHPEWVVQAKGEEREKKPMALAATTHQMHPFIDIEAIRPDLQFLFDDPELLARHYAWLGFLKVPVLRSKVDALPEKTLSGLETDTPFVQFWDPRGNRLTAELIKGIQSANIPYVGISSLNRSGTPELTTAQQGEDYCNEKNIPIFLKGVTGGAEGSFTILGVDRDGMKVYREGNIPSRYLVPENSLAPNQPSIREPKFPPYEVPQTLFETYSNNQPLLRLAMLAHLNGHTPERIIQTLKTR